MMPGGDKRPRGWWIERTFALAVLVLIVRAFWILSVDGYLPQPFFYEPSDTWMDWFNTAYWARDPGTYDNWRSIYPPLTFVVIKAVGIGRCYAGNEGLGSRDCDWVGIVAIHAIFVLNIFLIAKTYLKMDARTALPRAVALAAGLPMLFALERGNILLLAFTCFLLAFGPLLRSARAKWLFAGLAVNFKVYLVGAIVAQLLRRRWFRVERSLVAIIAVYLASYAILGTGTPWEVYRNITDYSSGFAASQVLDIWYSLTYQPLISLLRGDNFPITAVLGSDMVETGLALFPRIVLFGQLSLLIAAAAAWLRPHVVSPHRMIFLGTCLALISSEAGGYTQMMVIFLVFMERWRGVARPIAICLCYILCLPGDILVGEIPPIIRDSYLAGHTVEMNFGVGLGMFLRPGILIAIGVSLSTSTVRDVWADIRAGGWTRSGRSLGYRDATSADRPDATV